MKEKKLFEDKIDIVICGLICVAFGYFALKGNVAECGDSFQYEKQLPMREPVYSLILQLFQVTTGEYYMRCIGIFQNILTCICTLWSYKRLRKVFGFGRFFSMCMAGALMAPHLLTPLASRTHLILTNTIMTEGITVGLYYVWLVMLICILGDYYDTDKAMIKAVVLNLLLSLVLAMTRGQMVLCIAMWLLVICFVNLKSNYTIKRKIVVVLGLCASALVTILAKGQLTKWYNLAETGYYVNTVSAKPMILANLVYVCDESDADYIEDEDLRNFFKNVIALANENELTFEYATGGIIEKARFHESGHETLNFDYIDSEIRPVILERYGIDEGEFVNLIIHEDMLCGQVVKQLLPNVLGKYIKNYAIIASLGFVRSVSVEKSVLVYWAVIAYIMAIVLTIIGIKKEKARISAITMLLILVIICGTVLGTSLMIQCITRYMIYNLPFFYIAGMGLIKEIFGKDT